MVKFLKKRSELKTKEEKDAYGLFDTLVFNLKKLLGKLPAGRTVLASYAAALFLIKEQSNHEMQDQVMLYESFSDYLDEVERNPKLRQVLINFMQEDVTNSAGGGAIAGLGDGTVIVKQKPKVQKRKDLT
jgi:hypothetical protein